MKNLVAKLLSSLAAKEEESEKLLVQVEALEIVVSTLISKLDTGTQQGIIGGIKDELYGAGQSPRELKGQLLRHSLEKLLLQSRI